MATMLVLLIAVDEELGACFFGLPSGAVKRFRAQFGVPAAYTPIGAVTVGHRTGDPGSAGSAVGRRKPLEEVVHRGRWGGTVEEPPDGPRPDLG